MRRLHDATAALCVGVFAVSTTERNNLLISGQKRLVDAERDRPGRMTRWARGEMPNQSNAATGYDRERWQSYSRLGVLSRPILSKCICFTQKGVSPFGKANRGMPRLKLKSDSVTLSLDNAERVDRLPCT